jgi:sarcosine oxidase/L-pipecolate oxidase
VSCSPHAIYTQTDIFILSAFKFLPVLGECMTGAINKTLPSHLAEKWRFHKEYENRKDTFLGDGSRGGPARRELNSTEKAKLDGEARSKL